MEYGLPLPFFTCQVSFGFDLPLVGTAEEPARIRAAVQVRHSAVRQFGTVPYGSTETNLMTHYPDIYAYMKKYSKANAIEGVKAVKDGSVQGAPKLYCTSHSWPQFGQILTDRQNSHTDRFSTLNLQ